MSLPQGGFERRERIGGRRSLVWCAVALVLVVGWVWIVLGWDGSSGETSNGSSGREVAQTEDAGDGRGGAGEGQDSGASSVPEDSAYSEIEGADFTAPNQDMLQETGDPLAGGSLGRSDGAGAQGATNEPGVYDPLGTGASSNDLAPTDKARARYAAEKFVMAAYGYTGSDRAEYLAGVAETSLSPNLSLSEGGTEISRYADQVEKSGTSSAAVLTNFEFQKTSWESVRGVASFETGEGSGPDGGLTGELLAYRQPMNLSRMGATWKVKSTEKIEQVEQTQTASNEEGR